MARMMKISDEARDVLARCVITATSVTLPAEQLPRELYLQVNKVLVAAGGKWNRKAGAHLFSRDPREALGLAVESGETVNEKQARQAFYTPEGVADWVAEEADLRPGMHVLEPSCGEGALIAAALRKQQDLNIVGYDTDGLAVDRASGLACSKASIQLVEQDFLSVPIPPSPRHLFDRVLMNPPFTAGQDIAHVTHALRFLKPGGRLVTIMSRGWEHSTNKRSRVFRDLLRDAARRTVTEILPEGTFKESGTNISVLLLTVCLLD